MKKVIYTTLFCLFGYLSFAQAPAKMTYQAVVRDVAGDLVTNSTVGAQYSIIQGSVAGPVVFIEWVTVLSNDNGLITHQIGSSSAMNVDWSNGPYYVKVELDPAGGTSFTSSSTSQFLSVPYSLYAETADWAEGADYTSLTNAPTNVSAFTNDAGYITNPNDADSDPNNEIQSLTLVGQALTISGGNTVTLPSGGANTLDQAYDQGGSGVGRTITVDAGSVLINNTGSNLIGLEATSAVGSSTSILGTHNGSGVAIRAESTNPSNGFSAIQANTNSSNAINSAILGSNSGAGYGVTGQLPSTSTGLSAVYGNNLRTTGGYGVYGTGYNGVVGITNYGAAFALYGSNTGGTGLGIGTYGLGYNGVYGQTTDPVNGWAGYFTADIGCDGTGYSLGGWINVSDRRLKSNIVSIESPLEKLAHINGRHYTLTYKTKSPDGELITHTRDQYGVIAQEVESVFPEMVREKPIFNNAGDDTLYKTVEYTQLIPVLLESIKELNAKIENLEKKVQDLESN